MCLRLHCGNLGNKFTASYEVPVSAVAEWKVFNMALRYRLPREARLQKQCEFDAIRQKGSRIVRGCLIVNWLKLQESSRSKVGVVVGRRVGPAVVRTRARRLLREVFRLHQDDFVEPVALVLVARPSINDKKLSDVDRDFTDALAEAGLLKDRAS